MTQKIKLMSEEERVIFTSEIILNKTYRGFRDMEDLAYKVSTKLLDECEKRATEKIKDAFIAGWSFCYQSENPEFQSSTVFESADEAFQQYLKEQYAEI